ncbi:MAG: hypothetical protein L0I76_19425 [Pseudonocardia sp.]|nr:hypothetical protein [Pseudonocardia sp.]
MTKARSELRRPGPNRHSTTGAPRRTTTWLPAIGGLLLVAVAGCAGGAGPDDAPSSAAPAAEAGASGQDPAPMQHDMPGMAHDMPGMEHGMAGMQHGDTAGAGGTGGGHHGSGTAQLWAVQSAVGDLATDGSGRILYRSDADTTAPPASRCVGACTQEWQPFTVPAGQQPDSLGVDDDRIGTLNRPDGAVQVTLAGAPLYTHRGDDGRLSSRADTGGWHAVTPRGDKAARTGS